jgi:hypothetical protein
MVDTREREGGPFFVLGVPILPSLIRSQLIEKRYCIKNDNI